MQPLLTNPLVRSKEPDLVFGNLLPYQIKWIRDKSRFKIGLWARQTGKDYATTAEAVLHSLRRPGAVWIVLASGERQALESVAKAKRWAEAFNFSIDQYVETRPSAGALMKSAEILWENGSRLISLPANPDTARGYSGNLILTEFAFHENPAEIWRSIYPSISNPLQGGAKKVRIISTPNGPASKFFDLWTKDNHYSRHKVTIHDAVAQGLPVNVQELKEGLDDPDGWIQEYECEFIDGSSVLLPYDLISPCEDPDATEHANENSSVGYSFLGIDFGRKRDLTVCWSLENVGDVLWTREVLVLNKMSTPEQLALLEPRIEKARQICVDYTGPGIGLGDFLVQRFGEHAPDQQLHGKVELCTFTPRLKSELFPKLRVKFEQKALRIPISPAIREDLHGIHKIASQTGHVTYRAVQTPDGHSDRCTALALALRAAEIAPLPFCIETIPHPRGRRPLRRSL